VKRTHTTFAFMADKRLIINLIKEDLKTTHLISGLSNLGLEAGKYSPNLGHTIIDLMSFQEEDLNEKLHKTYSDNLSLLAQHTIFESPDKLDFLAQVLFLKLLGSRTQLQQVEHLNCGSGLKTKTLT
jgi:hypothetical protein